MKINGYALPNHLKQPYPIYLLVGDEWLLKQEARELIVKRLNHAGFHEQVKLPLSDQFDWEQVYDYLYGNSLLDEKRIIEINLADYPLTTKITGILKEYANKINPHIMLILNMHKLDAKTQKAAWFTALEARSLMVSVWPLVGEQFANWVMRKGKTYQLKFEPAALHLLCQWTEGNLVAAQQALTQIVLLNAPQPIQIKTIEAVLSPTNRFSVYALIDSLIGGEVKRAIYILQQLAAEKFEPIILLGSLAKELRLLSQISFQQKNHSLEKLFREYRIFPQRQTRVRKFLSKHTTENCYQFINDLANIDQLIKSGDTKAANRHLEIFCLKF